jgi:mannan endo-1,4-beta-mannosidase
LHNTSVVGLRTLAHTPNTQEEIAHMTRAKWAVSAAALALVTTVSSTTLAAAATVPGTVYGDTQAAGVNKPQATVAAELAQAGVKDVAPGDYFAGSVTVVLQSGLMAPDANGSFNADGRADGDEAVAVFAKVLGLSAKTDTNAEAAQKARDAGLTNGPVGEEISRLDVARLLAKALGLKISPVTSPEQYPFWDYSSVSAEDAGLLAALYQLGVFKGYEDGTFRPAGKLTRGELALLVDRVLGAFNK